MHDFTVLTLASALDFNSLVFTHAFTVSDFSYSILADFCANCQKEKSETVQLKACTKCQISQYCSINCQLENWNAHKFACSIVANQRMKRISGPYQ